MTSDNQSRITVDRRKRVQALKKLIILTIAAGILIPVLLCIAALSRVSRLEGKLSLLSGQVEELTQALLRQQEQLEEMKKPILQQGEGSAAAAYVNGAAADTRETEKPEDTVTAEHKVYLTFDDGPSSYTDEILDILDRYQVKATFFVTGKEDEKSQKALREIADRGHSLGMHSYSHKYREIYASEEAFREDFYKIQDLIYEVTGVESHIYRFPGGSSNTISDLPMELFGRFLEEQGVQFYDWNASSGDGGRKMPEVDRLLENSMDGIDRRENTVILLHDSAAKRTTVEALPLMIENILAMEDTVILPITEATEPVQHIEINRNK